MDSESAASGLGVGSNAAGMVVVVLVRTPPDELGLLEDPEACSSRGRGYTSSDASSLFISTWVFVWREPLAVCLELSLAFVDVYSFSGLIGH